MIQQKIVRFQITMTDLNLMNVLDTRYNLLSKTACFLFSKSLSLDDVVEQLTTTGILHDEEELT